MDKKHILGSGIDYDEINQLPELHIQRKKSPKLLDTLTAGLTEERAKQFLKNEIKNIFQNKFSGKSDYDAVKRKLARKIFLYDLIRLKTNKPETTPEGVPLNLTIAKF